MKIKLTLILLLFTASTAFSQQLNIGTYNLRYSNGEDSTAGNGWGQRFPWIAKIIRFQDLDIFGTQEAKYHQLTELTDSLPGYRWIGAGRDDGKHGGEHSAIFYKAGRFKLLKTGNFWMSAITDKPNKGWDAALPRICTWAQFREVKTGFTFYFFNLHMDHIGVIARRESAKLVLQKIRQMAGATPTILTGDFNVDQTSDSYAVINNSGVLKDSYMLSPVKLAPSDTFNDFDANTAGDKRIDHIFVTKQFKVKRYAILTNTYHGRTPSDHYPVVAIMGY
ncbi:endonuclease/exonuclease/phosphatase family protein [Mucilaginibacter phyllosphaerae]|uniref:Endonuclease/exonuclease/phosphatase family metal-dependent hydrolase n=1 Tax=Mucilaginibacter phyllosphaerae TaxID=1812349 RepID=A0A4Y8AGL8_9SPHI|nr:endonuclease/exonuclease/phosphatase family protein [Mucilaginibacter phyllosphaerae]MBB3968485.1 endonuclease/exonuclease/phosphatase family metal-dependent hydrolase [Mucilaginibacter phyllosphaerae]TEW67870.1 endonuclease/exonuclease/phosphatase family protein [Mucilaginibacter phyllosphaerae]